MSRLVHIVAATIAMGLEVAAAAPIDDSARSGLAGTAHPSMYRGRMTTRPL